MVPGNRSLASTLYICSAGHSGSTLLDLMLGSHSSIESLGEITQLPKNIALNTECCCGQAIRDCDFWRSVIAKLDSELGIDVFSKPYSLNLGFINATDVVDHEHQNAIYDLRRRISYASRFAALKHRLPIPTAATGTIIDGVRNKAVLYEAVIGITNSKYVVDSSKHYIEAVSQYLAFPDSTRIIFLVRDGRAVFYSGVKRGYGRERSLGAWLNTYSRALPLIEGHVPEKDVFRVKYEDLVSQPQQVLSDIAEFAGLDFEESMLNFVNGECHIANGNNMRFADSSELKLDTSWINNLKEEDLAFFESNAGQLNRALGYGPLPNSAAA